MRFISEHKERFGVEPVCRVLTQHGCKIAPSSYYDAVRRAPSARAVRDEQLKAAISRVHQDNFGVYGARKIWLALNREGIPVARCTVERLMRDLGLHGARRGKKVRTTVPAASAARPADLVRRFLRGRHSGCSGELCRRSTGTSNTSARPTAGLKHRLGASRHGSLPQLSLRRLKSVRP